MKNIRQRTVLYVLRSIVGFLFVCSIHAQEPPAPEELQEVVIAAWNFVGTLNTDWQPFFHDFGDGIPMALVPVGCFTMGTSEKQFQYAVNVTGADSLRVEKEQPAHEVCSEKPFWIDVTEVTQADFLRLEGKKAHLNTFEGDQFPVETIRWGEAHDFCELRDARLPTELEWEFAARGVENFIFPWGNEVDKTALNYCDANCEHYWHDVNFDDGATHTAAVGQYPDGVSWVGVLDLSGNVWEWTSSHFAEYPYDALDGRERQSGGNASYTIRGGGWADYPGDMRTTSRDPLSANSLEYSVGFRCVRAVERGFGVE